MFKSIISVFKHKLWICGQVNLAEPHWLEVQIVSGNGKQKAITLPNVDLDLCNHMASLGHNELSKIEKYW